MVDFSLLSTKQAIINYTMVYNVIGEEAVKWIEILANA